MPVMTRQEALQVLSKWLAPQMQPSVDLESDWETWVRTLFGKWVSDKSGAPVPFGAHHAAFWNWIWSLKPGIKAPPFIGIWPRGGAKSTSAEMGVAAVAARRSRKYCLYISATQPQADDHIQNISQLLESEEYAKWYPAASSRRVGKYGYSRGWNRQRLRTASGFTADAIGLDTAARGVKLEEARPDFIILDDIDKELDTPEATEKKIKLITTAMLPAGATDSAVLGIQNLVIEDGVFARLAGIQSISKQADFLQNREVSGPFPAVLDAQVIVPTGLEADEAVARRAGKYTIVGGTPIWAGQGLDKAQRDIDEWGYTAWLTEAQQEVESPTNGLFGSIDFERIQISEADFNQKVAGSLVRTVVWCDPAITNTDRSDSHGVQADSLGADDLLYRRRSWEGRETPEQVLRRAIRWAIELNAECVGVETDQGGDLWEIAYNKVWAELERAGEIPKSYIGHRIPFRAEKAGAGYGNKVHRGSLMLRDYEANLIRHVVTPSGDHLVLKRALLRAFVKKPFDLADAAFWGWNDLKGALSGGIGASSDEDMTPFGTRINSALGNALHGRQADLAWRAESDRMRIGRLWAGHHRVPGITSGTAVTMGAVQGDFEETRSGEDFERD